MKKFISGILSFCLCLPMLSPIVKPMQTYAEQDMEFSENAVVIDGLVYELFGNQDEIYHAYLIGIEDSQTTSITIPTSIKKDQTEYDVVLPSTDIFRRYEHLKEIQVKDPKEKGYYSIGGVLFFNHYLMVYPPGREGAYTAPEETNGIGPDAFLHCTGLESLSIPESCELTGIFSISECPALKSVTVPSLDGELTIEGCTSLQTMELSGALKASIVDCPELTELHCSGDVALEVQNADKLTVYGKSEFKQLQASCTALDIPYITTENIMGDANGDSKVNILDVITINRVVLGKEVLTAEQAKSADLDHSGIIDATDSLHLLKYLVGLIDFPDIQ